MRRTPYQQCFYMIHLGDHKRREEKGKSRERKWMSRHTSTSIGGNKWMNKQDNTYSQGIVCRKYVMSRTECSCHVQKHFCWFFPHCCVLKYFMWGKVPNLISTFLALWICYYYYLHFSDQVPEIQILKELVKNNMTPEKMSILTPLASKSFFLSFTSLHCDTSEARSVL